MWKGCLSMIVWEERCLRIGINYDEVFYDIDVYIVILM